MISGYVHAGREPVKTVRLIQFVEMPIVPLENAPTARINVLYLIKIFVPEHITLYVTNVMLDFA